MTVMVIGASGMIGRALVPLLVRKDEVRACVRRPEAADPLRTMGAKVAVGFDDADALAEILKRVYTVVHLVGGPNQADDDAVLAANHGSVVTALAASREAGVRRFVLVSATGAAVDASNPYLRAKGLAEEAVANSGLEHAIVRSTHAYGIGGLWLAATVAAATASPPFVVGDGSQPLAPVFAGDVAAVVAAADDRDGHLEGTWALEGPDVVTMSELVTLLAAPGAPAAVSLTTREAVARFTEGLGTPVSPTTAELYTLPSRADAPDAAEAFGVDLTALADGLQALARTASAER
ncbi:MAG: SDR family oxidoreductase [Actinomycetota bacterium]